MPKKVFKFLVIAILILLPGIQFNTPVSNAQSTDSPKADSVKFKIISIAAGRKHTLALKEDGTVWAWGSSGRGQLGNGAFGKSNQPVQVVGLQNIIAIVAGESHSLALKKDGTVWTWGINNCLGNNNQKSDANLPIQVKNLKEVVSIGGGFSNSIAVKKDGTVWAWGDNTYSQLGKKLSEYRDTLPVQVSGLKKVKQATYGLGYGLAINNNGTVWAWGWNKNTHLCVSKSEKNSDFIAEPEKVRKIRKVKEVFGNSFILALKTDGTVWRWGDVEVPGQINGMDKIKNINTGYAHCMAVKNDGTVWTWGYNDQGQLGNGVAERKYFLPGQVRGLTGIIAVSGGEGHSVALSKDGTVWTWGMNDRGQLGDGSFLNKPRPVKVVFKQTVTKNSISNPKLVNQNIHLKNTTIKDLSNWNHPVKTVFETYGFKLMKVEIIPKNQLPIYIVSHDSTRSIYDETFLNAVADQNSYGDFIIVDNRGFVEVYCDKKQKKIIKAVTDKVQKNK